MKHELTPSNCHANIKENFEMLQKKVCQNVEEQAMLAMAAPEKKQ